MNNDNSTNSDNFSEGDHHRQKLKKQREDIARIFKKGRELAEKNADEDLDKIIDIGSILSRTSRNQPLLTTEPQPYQVTFPLEFYRQIYRLNSWDSSGDKLYKRPGIVGTWTNWIIYIKYPVGTIKWIRENNPSYGYGSRPYKYFQFFTTIGKSHLYEFIQSAIELMSKCGNWDQFKRLLAKGYNKPYQTDMFDKDDVDWKPRK